MDAQLTHHTTACAECDLLVGEATPGEGYNALCPRCGHILREGRPDSVLNGLVLSTTGLLLFTPAVGLPVLIMSVGGLRAEASLIDTVTAMINNGYWHVGLLVLLFSLIMPFLNLWVIFAVTLAIRFRQPDRKLRWLMRLNHHVRAWSMTEVFFLGVLISIVKLKDLAHLLPGPGLVCYLGLMLTCVLLNTMVEEHELWQSLEKPNE